MSDDLEFRDRVTRLEADMAHLLDRQKSISDKVDAMFEVLMQAKGAKWVIVGSASIGGAIAGLAATFLGIFHKP